MDIELYYYNARWHDPETGRFISEDPAADPNNPNLYSYCGNNPLVRIDPSGESFLAALGIAVLKGVVVWAAQAVVSGLNAWTHGGNFWSGFSYGLAHNSIDVRIPPSGSNDANYIDPKIDLSSIYGYGETGDYEGRGGTDTDNGPDTNVEKFQTALENVDSAISVLEIQLSNCTSAAEREGIEQQILAYYQLKVRIKNQLKPKVGVLYLIWPTVGRISSPYDPNRPGFYTKKGVWVPPGHWGIDTANAIGTPIVAMADGKVIANRYSEGSGWILEIDYGGGVASVFHYLNKQSSYVVGTKVTQGQIVAYMGNTGKYTTGPHLHFELKINGQKVNPNDYLPER